MSLLCLAVLVALGIWFTYGSSGLGTAAMVAAMIAAGVGVESFLNTFWKSRRRELKETSSIRFWKPRRIISPSLSGWHSPERRAPQPSPDFAADEIVNPRRRRFAAEES
jgi:hypothetical protein